MEEELIDKAIDMLVQLDVLFERLKNDNIEKLCIYSKIKELIFWLTYYKDNLESENGDEDG